MTPPPDRPTVAQAAAAARLAARALFTTTTNWPRWLPDKYALAAAGRVSTELARSIDQLSDALKQDNKDHDE